MQVGAGPPFRNPPPIWDFWGTRGAALRVWGRRRWSREDLLTRSGQALAYGALGFSLMAKKGLLARKIGMTQVFNADGTLSAVTVLEAGPCRVLGLRTPEKDGYTAVRLAFAPIKARRLSRPLAGEFKRAGVDPARYIAEVRDYEGPGRGQELTCVIFAEGEPVDVTPP